MAGELGPNSHDQTSKTLTRLFKLEAGCEWVLVKGAAKWLWSARLPIVAALDWKRKSRKLRPHSQSVCLVDISRGQQATRTTNASSDSPTRRALALKKKGKKR
ncbi:hypothetical protein PspLS_09713 [Pyricularia sp. CBS 133598]|nr:hypothetical protein PspLS_09713 [Pyricularia sp. CBS 133598]